MTMTATVVMIREMNQSDCLTQLLTTAQMNSVTEDDNDNGDFLEYNKYKHNFTYTVYGKNKEGPSTCNFCDNSNKLRISSTEVGVMCILCDLNILIAAFTFSRAPIHMAELGAPDSTPPQLVT